MHYYRTETWSEWWKRAVGKGDGGGVRAAKTRVTTAEKAKTTGLQGVKRAVPVRTAIRDRKKTVWEVSRKQRAIREVLGKRFVAITAARGILCRIAGLVRGWRSRPKKIKKEKKGGCRTCRIRHQNISGEKKTVNAEYRGVVNSKTKQGKSVTRYSHL